jgi:large subunit ribosomal protein L3
MAIEGIIGRKIGMTQVYAEDGRAIPATVIQAGPCVVVQRKSKAARTATHKNKKTGHTSTRQVTDGYEAVQLGLVEDRKVKKITKAQAGHFKKTGGDLPPVRVLREFRLTDGDEAKVGDKVSVEIFKAGDTVNIVGTSKGKGFQGVVKRHHFRGGAATHGSMFHRAPGSIGASAYPSRVLKGMRGAGHMGSDRVTTKNLTVVRVDAEKNILVVKGSVPGAGGSYVVIRKGAAAPKPRREGRERKNA